MAEAKGKSKGKTKEEIEKEKPEEGQEELEETDDDEEFESAIINPGTTASFRYPFLRRLPSIRIQPVAAPLEIELGDIPANTKKEENNAEQYKPSQLDKNYSPNQKYELPGGAAYENITPKTISAPVSPSLNANFQGQTAMGFGNQGTSTSGYPGQESNGRKYDSGLEQQAKEQERERRRNM